MGVATGSYPLQDYPVATVESRGDSSLTVASRFGERQPQAATREKPQKRQGRARVFSRDA